MNLQFNLKNSIKNSEIKNMFIDNELKKINIEERAEVKMQ